MIDRRNGVEWNEREKRYVLVWQGRGSKKLHVHTASSFEVVAAAYRELEDGNKCHFCKMIASEVKKKLGLDATESRVMLTLNKKARA